MPTGNYLGINWKELIFSFENMLIVTFVWMVIKLNHYHNSILGFFLKFCYCGDIVKIILLGISSYDKYCIPQSQLHIHNYPWKGKSRTKKKERKLEITAISYVSKHSGYFLAACFGLLLAKALWKKICNYISQIIDINI